MTRLDKARRLLERVLVIDENRIHAAQPSGRLDLLKMVSQDIRAFLDEPEPDEVVLQGEGAGTEGVQHGFGAKLRRQSEPDEAWIERAANVIGTEAYCAHGQMTDESIAAIIARHHAAGCGGENAERLLEAARAVGRDCNEASLCVLADIAVACSPKPGEN